MYKFLLMLILLFVAGLTVLNAQEIQFNGTVRDSLQYPLYGANLIAFPISGNSMKFAISDDRGRFELALQKKETYKLEITFIGFQKINDTLTLSEDTRRNYILIPNTESLDEVIIRQSLPVLVKKDTTRYRTKYFTDGKERKLQEVLEKLPGIEVDNGSIFFKGKKVEKILVENKIFFSGDTKLAVENIPENAVNEVEVLENYTDIPFLKDLDDSGRTVMNIKLAEGKKKFVFGDIAAGGGFKERYLIHPSLFYYSPKTAVNFIGDINNIGTKKFTLQNYINFEGGYQSMMNDPNKFSLVNDEFAQHLSEENFVKNSIYFGAANLHQQLGKNLNLSVYSIRSYSDSKHEFKNFITYTTSNDTINERRLTNQNQYLNFSLNKIGLEFIPNDKEHLGYQAYLKTSGLDAELDRISIREETTNQFFELEEPEDLQFEQQLDYSKQHNATNTTSAKLSHNYSTSKDKNQWTFPEPIFNTVIPLEEQESFRVNNEQSYSHSRVAFGLKHYLILDGKNHIYPSVGIDFSNDHFNTLSYQQLTDKTMNDFQGAGFNNDNELQLGSYFAGFHYKWKSGSWLIKPGVFYRQFDWKLYQFETRLENNNGFISPELEIAFEPNSSHKIKLDYQLNSNFPGIQNLANRYRLINFNRVFKGDDALLNNRSHKASLRYFQFDLFNKYYMNFGVQMRSQYKGTQRVTELMGINQLSTVRFAQFPQHTWNFHGNLVKTLEELKLKLNTSLVLNNYESLINEEILQSSSKTYSVNGSAELISNKFREMRLGMQYQKSYFYSGSFNNNTLQLTPYLQTEFLWKSLLISGDYEFQYYANASNDAIDNLHFANLSFLYQPETSPWEIEISLRNLLNNEYKRTTSENQYLIEDNYITIQPRTALLTFSYKL